MQVLRFVAETTGDVTDLGKAIALALGIGLGSLGAGIGVQGLLFVVWQLLGLGGLGSGWDFFAILRLTIGLIFPALLTYAGWRTARARSMESATGLLYIDLGAVATGTILASGLFFGAGILV